MKDTAAAKKNGQQAPPAPTRGSVSGAAATITAQVQAPVPNVINTPITSASNSLETEKKKEGTNWILWGALGIAGIFLGVNFYKNRQ
jgi:hypothetical protein